MADDIKLVVGADYSQLTALIRTTGQTKTAVKLLAQDFAKTGSQSQYMKGINKIVSAQKNLKDSSRMSQSEIMKLGAQMRQQAQFADALANATNRASVSQKKSTIAQMAATKASNRLGVVTQQAGYQVSDFVVQVQSGTNPLVAFSQQASQLVGVLPLVADGLGMTAKSAIALSAGLGIAIPLISSAAMVIINMMNASEEAQKQMDIMDKGFDEISSSLSKLNSALKTAAEDGLTTLKERYGEVTAEVLRLQSALIEIEKTATKKSIQSQIQTSFTPEFYSQLSQGFNPTQQAVLAGLGDPAALAEEVSFLENEISSLTSSIENRKRGGLFVDQSEIDLLADYKDELAALRLDFENAGKLKEELAIDQYIFEGYAKLQEQVKSALAGEQYEKAASAISSIRDLAIQAGIDVSQGAFANLTQLEDMLRQFSTATKDLVNQFDPSAFAAGMDNRTNEEIQASVELTNEMVKSGLEETMNVYTKYAALRRNGFKEERNNSQILYDKMQVYYKQAGKLMTDGETQARQEQLETTNQAITNAELAKQNAMYKAQEVEKERQKQADQTHAHMMALQNAYFEDNKKKSAQAGMLQNYQIMMAYQAYGESRAEGAKTTPPKPPKGKTPSTIEDNIKAMEREMEAERKLIGLEGERRRAQELYQELLYANQDADIKTTETRLRNLANQKAAQEEYIRKLDEEKQRQEDLANSIGSSFETALMSIVDGTKSVEDAFRTMAIEVIKELYRVLVVQKMVNAAKMAFGFADGGVIHNGSVVPYASGGVVGGPTYFPMSGGRTGLMGEAGPEAIMPLKRGKGGKLGVEVSGDTKPTVIHQNFNFSANGDESVKRMIAQAAPQIAKMTEKGIMDSRRRGGQMKAVFG